MTPEARKVIKWAASESNGHGGHIDAINYAINSGFLSGDTLEQVKQKAAEWVEDVKSSGNK